METNRGPKNNLLGGDGLGSLLRFISAFTYLSGNPQAVQGFGHVGYPQQLRIILGIAKPLGAIALLVPGFPKLKEWAYAGFTFAWICAFIAHYLAGDGPKALMPVILLVIFLSLTSRSHRLTYGNRSWISRRSGPVRVPSLCKHRVDPRLLLSCTPF